MVVYCTGNVTAKRRAFRSVNSEDSICVDNDEIIATYFLNSKLYFLIGEIPYSNMSVEQFVACARALKTQLPLNRMSIKEMVKQAGYTGSSRKKLGRLSRIEYRAVALAAKTDFTVKNIYLNFDGLEYSRKNSKQLKKFLAVCSKAYGVHVSVSDARFLPPNAQVLCYGSGNETVSTSVQKSVKKRILRKKLILAGMDIRLPSKVVRVVEL